MLGRINHEGWAVWDKKQPDEIGTEAIKKVEGILSRLREVNTVINLREAGVSRLEGVDLQVNLNEGPRVITEVGITVVRSKKAQKNFHRTVMDIEDIHGVDVVPDWMLANGRMVLNAKDPQLIDTFQTGILGIDLFRRLRSTKP